MIFVNKMTSLRQLSKIKIGDKIVDEFQVHGFVVRINENRTASLTEFIFHLDSRQTIYIMSRVN